jgi:hypothetical protein
MNDSATAITLLTDEAYFKKAKRTIVDVRSRGEWLGDIVVIVVGGFALPVNFKEFYNLIEVSFPAINKDELVSKIKGQFTETDGREVNKLNQWEKLHVFDIFFRRWQRIIFLDAGLRVLDSVRHLLDLNYKGFILAPNDAGFQNKPTKLFRHQLSFHNPQVIEELLNEYGGASILDKQYMLNCIWIYDTSILNTVSKAELIATMFKYPCCKTNETVVMNLVFHFKYGLWREFPYYARNDKFLFDWSELNNPNTTWHNYCYIKYPVSISFEDC